MAIDQGQSGWGMTTGGSPFRSGGLSLRARAWFAVLCRSCGRRLRVARTVAARAVRRHGQGPAAGPCQRPLLSPPGTRTVHRGMGAVPPAPEAGAGTGAGCPAAHRTLSRHFRRRRQRRVRFRPSGRLDRSRRSPRVSGRDGRQHRRPDRPVRVPRAGLRSSSSATSTRRSRPTTSSASAVSSAASSMMRCPTPRRCGT